MEIVLKHVAWQLYEDLQAEVCLDWLDLVDLESLCPNALISISTLCDVARNSRSTKAQMLQD